MLIAALSIDLVSEALESLTTVHTVLTVGIAAGLFSGVNYLLSKRGARHRKRCGDCVKQPTEAEKPESGQAIAIGTVMDAMPEALVLGVVLSEGHNALALVAVLALGNIAQSLSSTAGLADAGRSYRFIALLWGAVAIAVVTTTLLSFHLLGMVDIEIKPWVEAFAAGILLAMVAETMLPEASHKSPSLSGLQTAVGFCVFVGLMATL